LENSLELLPKQFELGYLILHDVELSLN